MTEGELGLDPFLERHEPEGLEALGLGSQAAQVRHAGKRAASPQRQGRSQVLDGEGRAAPLHRPLALAKEALEPTCVDALVIDVQGIPGGADYEAGIPVEDGPQARHIRSQGHACAGRRFGRPELVDEDVGLDRASRLEQEEREQRSLAPAADRQRDSIAERLDLAKDPELDHRRAVPPGNSHTVSERRHLAP